MWLPHHARHVAGDDPVEEHAASIYAQMPCAECDAIRQVLTDHGVASRVYDVTDDP